MISKSYQFRIYPNLLQRQQLEIVRKNQIIVTESLNVKGMMANHHLARSIADASFSELKRQIQYKATWYGRTHLEIDPWFPSSKTCSCCGHVLDELNLTVREWPCPKCGTEHDRDHNAAINILNEGLKQIHLPGSPGEDTRGETALVNAFDEPRTTSRHHTDRLEREVG